MMAYLSNEAQDRAMANRVHLDAMIPREDFAVQDGEYAIDLLKDFQISYLKPDSPILELLRKPDFQRETNHWTPEQVVTFIASVLDNEVVPSLIFWKAPAHIFVIDGGHRVSALRAWMEDDYGDKTISKNFYGGELSQDQLRLARRTRKLIDDKVGSYSDLVKNANSKSGDVKARRANALLTRGLTLQWVQGSPEVAETSFYKINSQGTPLDDVERLLIENRRKPIAIGSRVVLRAGSGHKYWSAFESEDVKTRIETTGKKLHDLLFEPESSEPLKTIDVPVGGSVSPVEALSLLVDFLTIAANRAEKPLGIKDYSDDTTGDLTAKVLDNSLEVLSRMIGRSKGSLGLHTAIYFYNERGKHSRFLFLGMASLVAEKLRNNDDQFFKKFTKARSQIEEFLIENKSLIGIILQNLGKNARIPRMRDMFVFLVDMALTEGKIDVSKVISQLGLRGRVYDVTAIQTSPKISDTTKSTLLIKSSIDSAPKCDLCKGRIEVNKSVSYDHITRKQDDGTGDISNVRITHPYCNNSRDSLL